MATTEGEHTLDAWVLAENKIVTYRLLSRLLRVKGQVAKDIMVAWHKTRLNTHATFVLCGRSTYKSNGAGIESETASDPSHLNPSSFLSQHSALGTSHTSVQLVPEEQLETVKSRFDTVSYCHIYSLESAKLTDIGLIAGCKTDIAEAMKGQSNKIADLAETYEIIFNAKVHELDQSGGTDRTRQRDMKPIFKRQESATVKTMPADNSINGSNQSKDTAAVAASLTAATNNTAAAAAAAGPAKDTKLAPALKRGPSNSLASAFAKTPKPKPKPTTPAASVAPSLSRASSSKEDAQPVSTLAAPAPSASSAAPADPAASAAPAAVVASSKTKETVQQREANAALRDMMMEDDESVTTSSQPNSQVKQQQQERDDHEMRDVEEDDWSASDTEMKDSIIAEAQAPAAPIRKRGRKKVKRQVHTKDAKGYMVTKEEWEWVSCDEDEVAAPAPALVKQSSSASSKSKTALQPKKKAAGGIASYFTKK